MRSFAPGVLFVLSACGGAAPDVHSTAPENVRDRGDVRPGDQAGGLGVVQRSPRLEDAHLRLDANGVHLGATFHALAHEPKFRMLDVVRAELPSVPGMPSENVAYTFGVAPGVRGAEFVSALQSAGFAGRRDAYLVPAEVVLHVRVPSLDPNATTIAERLHFPERALLVDVGPSAIEFFRVPAEGSDATAERRLSLPTGEVHERAATALDALCAAGDCSPLVITFDPAASVDPLLVVLEALAERSEFRRSGVSIPPDALVLVNREREIPRARLRLGVTAPSGRLPPIEIQKVIRAHFDVLRGCYESGLDRDEKLTGRVVVRFVIDREGNVSASTADPTSTMPDPKVTSCVVEAFEALRFPRPQGGIVTVTYPILFSPEKSDE